MIRRASPTRTCVGCRQRASAYELLRVVAIEFNPGHLRLTPDPRRVLSGRGAHLHPVPDCLESALRRRAFGRALRVTGVLDTGVLSEAIDASTGENRR